MQNLEDGILVPQGCSQNKEHSVSISLFWGCLDRHRKPQGQGWVRTRGQPQILVSHSGQSSTEPMLAFACCSVPTLHQFLASFYRPAAGTAAPVPPEVLGTEENALCRAIPAHIVPPVTAPPQQPQGPPGSALTAPLLTSSPTP